MKTLSEISRRELLKCMGLTLAASPLSRLSTHRTPAVKFVDVAQPAGIRFRHDNATSAEKYLIETMGSGCAWIDYDQDGLLDLYLVNGAATRVYTPPHALRSALYHNNGDGTFTDVTEKAGVG
ncbi:MAG: VCBS repeat-containing protein, partial [Candidatus Acidiferrales bacterium]